jgi:hypothetical protein
MMSYLHSGSAFDRHEFVHELETSRNQEQPMRSAGAADRALDAALRSVPLPDGLITRLGMFVYTMPDETADQVDCLGC